MPVANQDDLLTRLDRLIARLKAANERHEKGLAALEARLEELARTAG